MRMKMRARGVLLRYGLRPWIRDGGGSCGGAGGAGDGFDGLISGWIQGG